MRNDPHCDLLPRPYNLGKRKTVADRNRAKVLKAARDLLLENGMPEMTMDAIARRSALTRQTVHNQFGSKAGLIEALCDDLAARGGLEDLALVCQEPDPLAALSQHIAIFARFWGVDRLLTRRVRGLTAIDPEFENVLRARHGRRRRGLTILVDRLVEKFGEPASLNAPALIDALFSMTSFDFFDSLAGEQRTTEDVAPLVTQIVFAWLAGIFPAPVRAALNGRLDMNYSPLDGVNKMRVTT